MLSVCNFYMFIFEEVFDVYNLLLELKYLFIIELVLNLLVVLCVGVGGLWQFMIGIGKMYGLELNSLVDDCCDLIKVIWVVVCYLKDLYDIYYDWNFVIVVYNCGLGIINKVICCLGGEIDYWSIYNYLFKEIRGYVLVFIVVNYVMIYYCDYNICLMEINIFESIDMI